MVLGKSFSLFLCLLWAVDIQAVFDRTPCDDVWKTVYRCDETDLSYATVYGMNLTCKENQVCNYGYFEPCQPCMDNVHLCSDLYECLDESTVLIGMNVFSCPDSYVCNNEYSDGCTPCVQDPMIPTTKPTSTTQEPVSTTERILIPPDCNDGAATSNPCRPGPANKFYYYQCVRYSSVWYDYQAKPCAHKGLNPVCRNANVC